MHSNLKIGCIALLLLTKIIAAAILFEDDFQDLEKSAGNWTLISVDGSTMQFTDSVVSIENKSDFYSALAVLRSSETPSSFTVSAIVRSEYPGAGLYFCFHELRDGYGGYGALLSDNGVYLYKFYPESLSVVTAQVSPFVRLHENTLSISKCGSVINIFCNGFFICSVNDSEFSAGEFALIVPPLVEACFDDVIINTRPSDTLRFATFKDEFNEKSSFGWTKYGNALTDWDSGHLQIHTGSNQEYYTGIEIPLQSFSMKTSVRFKNGDSSSCYGFYVKAADDAMDTSYFYQFAITGDKRFVTGRRGLETSFIQHQAIHGKTFQIFNSDTVYIHDTLELNMENSVLQFYANGVKLNEATKITGSIIGAGIFISKGLNISFNEFQLTDPYYQNAVSIRREKSVLVNKRFNPVIIDLLGRCLSKEKLLTSKLLLKTTKSEYWEKKMKMREGYRLR